MPNRILREAILTSDRVNQLSSEAELFYRRLMSIVDDFGRFDGRPVILRARCFPLRLDSVSEIAVTTWLDECEHAGLIRRYVVATKPFVEVLDFRQQTRAKDSKFPAPPVIGGCVANGTQVPGGCAADAHGEGGEVGDGNVGGGGCEGVQALPPPPFDAVAELYHQSLPMAPRVLLDDDLRADIAARWLDGCKALAAKGIVPSADVLLAGFRTAFERAATDPVLIGNAPPGAGYTTPFVADLPWLMRERNFNGLRVDRNAERRRTVMAA